MIFDATASTCSQYSYTVDVLPATSFYDIEINSAYQTCNSNHIITTGTGDVVNAVHDFIHTDGIINGAFSLQHNLTINQGQMAAPAPLPLLEQRMKPITRRGSVPRACKIAVNKTAGTVTPAAGSPDFYVQGFNQVAGDFAAPPGNFKIGSFLYASQTIFNHQAGIFSHNNGRVIFDATAATCSQYSYTIDVLPATNFYDIEIYSAYQTCNSNHIITTGTGDVVNAVHDFIHTDGIINGAFSLQNNLTINSGADGGTGTITFIGTANETYYQAGSVPRACKIAVNKTAGTVTPAAGSPDFCVQGFNQVAGDFTAPPGNFKIGSFLYASQTIFNHQAGIFSHNNGRVIFDATAATCSQYTYTIDVLPATNFYDVEINSAYQTCNSNHIMTTGTGDVANAVHDFTHTDGIINGSFSLQNNLTINAGADGGTGTITFIGTANQTYYQAGSTSRACKIGVNKTAGTVTPAAGNSDFCIQGFNQVAGDFTAPPGNFKIGSFLYASQTIFNHQAGIFSHNNGRVILDATAATCSQYSYTVNVIPTTNFYDLEVNSAYQTCNANHRITTPVNDTIIVAHNLYFTDGMSNAHFKSYGDVTVGATFDGGTGSLLFSNTNSQHFDLSGANTLFDGPVIINKSAGNVTLVSNCQLDAVAQSISFIKGNLITSAANLLILGDNVTALSSSIQSFADGPVRKIGNDAFKFPVGKSGFYGAVSISAPSIITDQFTGEFFPADPDPSYDVTLKAALLDHISRSEYWIVERTNGTSNVSVTLSWGNYTNGFISSLPDLRVARWDSASWQNHGNGGTTGSTTSGTVITSGVVTAFGPFALASGTPNNPLLPVTTWAGTINENWDIAGNWDNGIPTTNSLAIIPVVATYPTLSSTQTIRRLTMYSNTFLTIPVSISLTVTSDYSHNGTVAGAGYLAMSGPVVQSYSGTGTINNLTVNNMAGVTVASGISNMLNISGTLNPVAGTLTTNGRLTLKSSAAGTARISEGDTTGNYISGNVIFEKYVPSRRSWKLISFPLKENVVNTINASLQEGAGGTGTNPNPGYGTHITGGSAANGFDQNPAGNPSMKEFNGISWVGITSTSQDITTKPAYFLFVRGSRGNNLSQGVSAVPDNTILRGTGPVKQGNQTIILNNNGWQLIGNPFPSPLNLKTMSESNGAIIKNNFKFWDPRLGGTNYVGGYVTASFDGSCYDFAPAPVSNISDFVLPGAAFYVEAKSAGTLAIRESHKSSGGNNLALRPLGMPAKIHVSLKSVNSDGTQPVVDGVMVAFDENFEDSLDSYDASKLPINSFENLSILKNKDLFSIERRKPTRNSDTVNMNLNFLRVKSYMVEVDASNFNDPLVTGYIEDVQTGVRSQLNLAGNSSYLFDVNIGVDPNRLRIIFQKDKFAVLPVTLKDLTATRLGNNKISVEWNVEYENNVAGYEIEKSLDGVNFKKVSFQNAYSTNSTAATYNWIDENPFNGNNFYRIKMVDKDGQFKYSKVVFVALNVKGNISIFPNPVENKTIQLQLAGIVKGVTY